MQFSIADVHTIFVWQISWCSKGHWNNFNLLFANLFFRVPHSFSLYKNEKKTPKIKFHSIISNFIKLMKYELIFVELNWFLCKIWLSNISVCHRCTKPFQPTCFNRFIIDGFHIELNYHTKTLDDDKIKKRKGKK